MDQLTSAFGALRADGVREFVPASQRQAQAAEQQQQRSGASMAVKEFVPGKGLVTAPAASDPVRQRGGPRGPAQDSASFRKGGGHAQGTGMGAGYEHQQQPEQAFDRRRGHEAGFMSMQQQQQAMSGHNVHDDIGQIHGLFTGRNGLTSIPRRRTLRSLFVPDDLRNYFAAQARASITSLEPDDPIIKEVPRKFHSIYPLDADPSQRNVAGSTGYQTCVFKAQSSRDGVAYAVRRIDNVRIHGNLHQVQANWAKVVSPNVVPLREVFTQHRALFLVHDYFPGAQTLREFIHARGNNALLPENVIWSIMTQILSGLRSIHAAGLSCIDLNPSRILISGRFRARIASAGLINALEPQPPGASTADQQFEDLLWVSRLTIALATMNLQSLADPQGGIQFMQSRYSQDLVAFAVHPIKQQMNKQRCTVMDMLSLSSAALLAENDALYAHGDALEETLARTYDCDRMFRLMTKLSIICERPPPPGVKPADSWSETDDRYVIKLFRDYVFHQVDDRGKPIVDFGHVIDCLNKLDAGLPERILLTARDGKSFLVVTYEDVRMCIEKAFHELFQTSTYHQHE